MGISQTAIAPPERKIVEPSWLAGLETIHFTLRRLCVAEKATYNGKAKFEHLVACLKKKSPLVDAFLLLVVALTFQYADVPNDVEQQLQAIELGDGFDGMVRQLCVMLDEHYQA